MADYIDSPKLTSGENDFINYFVTKTIGKTPNIFWSFSSITDMILSKKAGVQLQEQGLAVTADNVSKAKSLIKIPSILGREKVIPIIGGEGVTDAELENNQIYDGKLITPETEDVETTWAKFDAVDVGRALQMSLSKKQTLNKFMKNNQIPEAVDLLKLQMNRWLMKFRMGIANDVLNGDGSANRMAGIFNCLFNTSYAYGGITATESWWHPKIYDLDTIGTTAIFGYDTVANLNTRSKIVSATNSKTANVPILYDIISRALEQYYTENVDDMGNPIKPDVLLMDAGAFELIQAVKISKENGLYRLRTAGDGTKEKEVLEALYKTDMTFDGIPVVKAREVIKSKTGIRSLFDQTSILALKLDDFEFLAEESNNMKYVPFQPIPGQWNNEFATISSTLLFLCRNRARQMQIKLPAAFDFFA